MDQTSQVTGKYKKLFLFFNSVFADNYTFTGSIADHFLVDYSLSDVNDVDVFLDKSYLEQVKSFKNITNWSRYENTPRGLAYKSYLKLDEYEFKVDWIFDNTLNIDLTRQKNIFESIPVYSVDKNYRMQVLKKLSSHYPKRDSFNYIDYISKKQKFKLRLLYYIDQTKI